MKVRILYTDGLGSFQEGIWDKPEPAEDQIVVESIMTGVCRSDIAMMEGTFNLLPMHMMGHEGLGRVIWRGDKVLTHVNIGDLVATRGEPAYADVYNATDGTFVTVPVAEPRFILEPVACGVNLLWDSWEHVVRHKDGSALIIGSGFLAYVLKQTINNFARNEPNFKRLDFIGSSNTDLFPGQMQTTSDKYDVVFDLSSDPKWLDAPIYNENGVLVLGTEKFPDAGSNLGNLLWNNMTIKMPSPRSEKFKSSMRMASRGVNGHTFPDLERFWTMEYDRDTEWKDAFHDASNRKPGYNRGYIKWRNDAN